MIRKREMLPIFKKDRKEDPRNYPVSLTSVPEDHGTYQRDILYQMKSFPQIKIKRKEEGNRHLLLRHLT